MTVEQRTPYLNIGELQEGASRAETVRIREGFELGPSRRDNSIDSNP